MVLALHMMSMHLKKRMAELLSEFDERIREYRWLSLEATDRVNVARLRGKADATLYSRGQLAVALEWHEDESEQAATLQEAAAIISEALKTTNGSPEEIAAALQQAEMI